mmetsp:Transcript_29199/g.30321  ORF Transcript_29199/g.30321 Transcript_29199/m.30321 type:complete len:203 (-) Transcript_29199:111-719(-)
MEIPVRNYTLSEFKLVPNGNLKLSKKFYAKGTANVKLNSLNVIEEGVQLRGDLGLISMAQSTIIDKDALIRPGLSATSPLSYKHVKIGANCYIGKKSIVSALVIGNNTFVGNNCVLADRVEVGTCVRVLDNSYVPPDARLVDNGIYAGVPAKFIGENYESAELMMSEFCNIFYKNILITTSSNPISNYTSTNYSTNMSNPKD